MGAAEKYVVGPSSGFYRPELFASRFRVGSGNVVAIWERHNDAGDANRCSHVDAVYTFTSGKGA